MAHKQNSGKLTDDSFIFKEITWKIPSARSLPRSVDYEVRSPEFSFAGGTWVLCMYPNGLTKNESESCVDFAAYRLQSLEAQQDVYFKNFLKTHRGKEFEPFRHFHSFTSVDEKDGGVGVSKFLKFSKLIALKKILAPGGTLTVVFRVRTKSTAAVMETTSQKYAARPVRNFECTQLAAAVQDLKVLCDYKDLLLSRENCDVTLQVSGQKFEAHRAILGARSSVFASMLRHNMKEKKTGLIDVEDCDPEIFQDFLCFLYCGRVDSITSQNMWSLYTVADKYDVQDLRSMCLAFIKNNLTVDNFCDVITLALQHCENDLIKQATDFFVENVKKIVVTVKWKVFLHENTAQGNELLIKALGIDKSQNVDKSSVKLHISK